MSIPSSFFLVPPHSDTPTNKSDAWIGSIPATHPFPPHGYAFASRARLVLLQRIDGIETCFPVLARLACWLNPHTAKHHPTQPNRRDKNAILRSRDQGILSLRTMCLQPRLVTGRIPKFERPCSGLYFLSHITHSALRYLGRSTGRHAVASFTSNDAAS
jgi:hypothetical protein